MNDIIENEIELFFNKSIRDNNDNDNKKRENILNVLINNELDFSNFKNKDKWTLLYDKIEKLIFDIAERSVIKYNRYSIDSKAGRGYNYDFELTFFLGDKIIDIKKLEYKNSPSMKEYPECLSKYTKNDFVEDIKYHEFFYDTYLSSIIELVNQKFKTKYNIDDIDREVYLKECFKTDSNIKLIELIEKLEYENMSIECEIPKKRKKDKKYFKLKSDFVDTSISEYIRTIIDGNKFNGKSFLNKISEQGDKLFIFWDFKKQEFSIDSIDINNNTKIIDITHNIIREAGKAKNWNIFGKNVNTVVVRLDNNTQYECLLRWKNHKGVLGPAWQIKYVTHSSNIKRFK